VREICRAACQTSSSRTRDAITQELFNAPPMTQMENMLYDIDEFESIKNKIDRNCPIHKIRTFLSSIFHHRGHSYLDLPLLTPAIGAEGLVEESSVKLLGSCGSKVEFETLKIETKFKFWSNNELLVENRNFNRQS